MVSIHSSTPSLAPGATSLIEFRVSVLRRSDLSPLLELEQYAEMKYTRRWDEIGDFSFTVSLDTDKGTELLAVIEVEDGADDESIATSKGEFCIQVLRNGASDFVGIIYHVELEKTSDGAHTVTMSGLGIESILQDRIVIPASGLAYDVQGPDLASTVMMSYVTDNLISPLTSGIDGLVDADRVVALLSLGTDAGLGASLTVNGRFQRLSDLLTLLARASGVELGYEVAVDTETSALTFNVRLGQVRTKGEAAQAIFSFELDTGASFKWSNDGLNYASHIIAAGDGDGAARVLAARVAPDFDNDAGHREQFLDDRNSTTITMLRQSADAALAAKPASSFTVSPLPLSSLVYGTNWDLGDLVTIEVAAWRLSSDIRIVAVEVSLKEGSTPDVVVTFGRIEQSAVLEFKKQLATGTLQS